MRYKIFKWLLDDFIVIDTVDKKYCIYNTNIHNQIYDKSNIFKEIPKAKINGLIARSNGKNYLDKMLVIDWYIYNFFMNEDQQKQCRHMVSIVLHNEISEFEDINDFLNNY